MTKRIFEFAPRIPLEDIATMPKLGSAADLRALLAFLKKLGVFGECCATEDIARLMYSFRKTPTRSEKSDYRRLETILRGKPITAREIEFFRHCLRHAIGDNIGGTISDDEIMNGHALLTLKRAALETTTLHWEHLDPLKALIDFAQSSDMRLNLQMVGPGTNFRWAKRDGVHTPKPKSAPHPILTPDSRFMLTIPFDQSRTKPLVLNFISVTTESHRAGIELRAQLMRHIVQLDDGEGPWRVSEYNAKPLAVEAVPGRFGFLAIANAGRSVEQLFPEDFDPDAITDTDLQRLFEAVAQIGQTGTPPRIGLLEYEVQA